MKKILLVLCILCSGVFAQSVYLNCTADRSDKEVKEKIKFELKVDESSNSISYSDDKISYNTKAIFTSSTIEAIINSKDIADKITRIIEVNRENLSVKKIDIIYYGKLEIPMEYNGKCSVKKNKNKI